MTKTMFIEARDLRPGDIVVNPSGFEFAVTKVKSVGAGRRVYFQRANGKPASFSAPPAGLTRVFLPRPDVARAP